MKRLLWLDDVRDPHENDWLVFSPIHPPYEVVWVKDYTEFTHYIGLWGTPDAICFDHDLNDIHETENGEIEKTGMDCAKWLIDYCIDNNKPLPKWNCQSANPVGRNNINSLLNNFKKLQ